MTILLTGGTGYVGSHAAVALMSVGHDVVLLDNLCNSQPSVVGRIARISGRQPAFVQADIRDTDQVARVMEQTGCDAVLHFAGFKAVAESALRPLDYYDNNVGGSLSLLRAMRLANVRTLIFSSSATVYGAPQYVPVDEAHPLTPINPYGRTKLQTEEILQDICAGDASWRVACLRYFNPVGAHSSGLIGEDPRGTPSNLMPVVARAAADEVHALPVYGNDYPTSDGTGVRDYLHVTDLAKGHVAALDFLRGHIGWHAFNLGTGRGHTVLEVIAAFELACGRQLVKQVMPRRSGDIASTFADASKARDVLGWTAELGLDEMCESTWNWQCGSHVELT